MPIQDMSNDKFQRVIDARASANLEIFESILNRSKDLVSRIFPSNSAAWHDSDKARVFDVAKMIFSVSVSSEDAEKLAENICIPDITEIRLSPSEEGGCENTINREIGGF